MTAVEPAACVDANPECTPENYHTPECAPQHVRVLDGEGQCWELLNDWDPSGWTRLEETDESPCSFDSALVLPSCLEQCILDLETEVEEQNTDYSPGVVLIDYRWDWQRDEAIRLIEESGNSIERVYQDTNGFVVAVPPGTEMMWVCRYTTEPPYSDVFAGGWLNGRDSPD